MSLNEKSPTGRQGSGGKDMYALLAGFTSLMIFLPLALYLYELERYVYAGICSFFCGVGAILLFWSIMEIDI